MSKSFIDDRNKDFPDIFKSERAKLKNFEYIKQVNQAKKENQDLKNGLRQLNKSLDRILKGSKASKNLRFVNPVLDAEEVITKKIESTEFLINKYKKEILSMRESQTSQDFSEKVKINNDIMNLRAKIQELEQENSKILKSPKRSHRAEGKPSKKELKTLQKKYAALQALVNEDEKLIYEFQTKVRALQKVKSSELNPEVCETDIEVLKLRIKELENQKKQEESSWKSKISELKQNVMLKEKEIQDLESSLKEKDKTCRVKKMQIKAQQRENRVNVPAKVPSQSSRENLSSIPLP